MSSSPQQTSRVHLSRVANALLASAADVIDAAATVEAAHRPGLSAAETAVGRWYAFMDRVLAEAEDEAATREECEGAITRSLVNAALCFEALADALADGPRDDAGLDTTRAVDAARQLSSRLLSRAEDGSWLSPSANLTAVDSAESSVDVAEAVRLTKRMRKVLDVLLSKDETRDYDASDLAAKADVAGRHIYTVMRDLEAAGFVESYWADPDETHRVYSLTAKGRGQGHRVNTDEREARTIPRLDGTQSPTRLREVGSE